MSDASRRLQQNTVGYRIFNVFNTLLMLIALLLFLYPLLNVIANSMSSGPDVVAANITFYPKNIDFFGYRLALGNTWIQGGYFNSIIYAGVGTVCNLILTSLVAYALSKRRMVFRGVISFLIAFTLFFSGGLIPTFLLVKTLGLYNSRAWIIMSQFFGVWAIIMLRTFFQAIPDSLEDSAKIDGYSDPRIMFLVYMPLSTPILATLALFSIVGYWNDYFTALVYLSSAGKYPLQMVLRDYLIPASSGSMYVSNDIFLLTLNEMRGAGWSVTRQLEMAVQLKNVAIVVSALPLVAVMLPVQRYFRQGVLIGALKD